MRASFQFTGDPPFAMMSVAGELDLGTSDQLCDILGGLAACGCTRLALDLQGVTFVDAYSLRLLDQHRRRLAAHGGAQHLVAASDCVAQVIELAGYEELRPVTCAMIAAHRPDRGSTTVEAG